MLAENKDHLLQLPHITTNLLIAGEGSQNNNNLKNSEIPTGSVVANITPLKILIVDDTIFNIVALKMLLKQLKHIDVEEAYNGQ